MGILIYNVTILSSSHCSAPSAWSFIGNIIGFSWFRWKLVIFVPEIYMKSNGRLLKNTHVFEPTFSGVYFTGWCNLSENFSVFCRFNRFYLCFFLFLIFFTILFFCWKDHLWTCSGHKTSLITVLESFWVILKKKNLGQSTYFFEIGRTNI